MYAKICMPLLYPQGYHAKLVIVVVHRLYNWVRLLIASFLGKLHCAFWYYEGKRLSGHIQVRSLGPVSEVHCIFCNNDVPSFFGDRRRGGVGEARKGKSHSLQCFGNLLDSYDQQLRKGLLMPGIGVLLVCGSWGNLTSSDGKILLFKLCMYMDIKTYMYYWYFR